MRGRLPKPSAVRQIEGMRGHRPLPKDEPKYAASLPQKPKSMSAGARRIWDELVEEMAGAAVLRRVDRRALWQLSEDEAILSDAYAGLWQMVAAVKRKAKSEGKDLPQGAVMAVLSMTNGRLAMSAIRDLANRTIIERREFGLTPSSRSRIETVAEATAVDALELALCG